jgi:hypothetical protein
MRIIAIVGGLLVGLAGLFMSVCGGGLLVKGAFHTEIWGIPAAFLLLGLFLCFTAYQIIRKRFKDE